MTTKKRKGGQRLCIKGYARVMRTIYKCRGKASRLSIANAHGTNRMTSAHLLRCFEAAGLVHVCAWEYVMVDERRSLMPLYRLGEGDSVDPPPLRTKGAVVRKPRPRPVPVEFLTFAHAIKALQEEPHHGRALADASGMSIRAAQQLLKLMHSLGLVFIETYFARQQCGLGAPMYRYGPGRADAIKPPPRPKEELWAMHNKLRHDRARGEGPAADDLQTPADDQVAGIHGRA